MYFLRSVDRPEIALAPDLLVQNMREMFSVSSRVNSDKEKQYREDLAASPFAFADHAAATFSALYNAKLVRPEVVGDMLELCRLTVEARGFASVPFRELPITENDRACLVVVAGCQNLAVLKRRVGAAVDFSRRVTSPFDIIFSGKYSATPPIRIRDEAARMEVMYEEMMAADMRGNIHVRPLAREKNSTRTVENIDNVLSDDVLVNKKKKHVIVIVSSTYHLIRIAEEVEKRIRENKFGLKDFVSHFCLIGAEDLSDIHAYPHEDWPSVKALMFELYLAHLR